MSMVSDTDVFTGSRNPSCLFLRPVTDADGVHGQLEFILCLFIYVDRFLRFTSFPCSVGYGRFQRTGAIVALYVWHRFFFSSGRLQGLQC